MSEFLIALLAGLVVLVLDRVVVPRVSQRRLVLQRDFGKSFMSHLTFAIAA